MRAPLEPSAIDPVHRGRAFCLEYGSSGGETCQSVDEESRLGSIAYEVSCPSGRAVVVGLLPAGTADARALLTDGRRIAVATREIPETLGLGPRRAALVDLRPSEGIRALELSR